MASDQEQFNQHQAEVKAMTTSLVKAVFLLAGGSLTVSIGIFTANTAPVLSSVLSCVLQSAWWLLFFSIIALTFTLFLIVVSDYQFAEKWRPEIFKEYSEGIANKPGSMYAFIWVFGVSGMVSFFSGLLGLAYVATSLI